MKTIYLTLTALSMATLIACGDKKDDKKEDKSEDTKTEEPTDETAEVTEEPEKNIAPLSEAEAMKAWMDYMTPGDMHALLAKSNGTWDEEVTMWMAPDAPPATSKSVAVNKMILGGRYQESNHSGSFDGMPFEGRSTLAYDNALKKFISTWIDNMGTGIMTLEGVWDEATKTINFAGKTVDPTTGKECNVRESLTFVDDNTHKIEMFTDQFGEEYKNMEITLKRKK